MKKANYSAPEIRVLDIHTHKIISASPNYSLEGEAGNAMTERDGGSLFSVLLICLLALGGCTKSPQPQQTTTITLTSEATRTTVQYDSVSGKYKPSWTKGDKLGIYIHNGSEYLSGGKNTGTAELAENCTNANFTMEIQTPNSPAEYNLYAYYPYGETGGEYYNASVNIPNEQHPSDGAFDPKADVLSSAPKTITIGNGQINESLQFARKTAIVRFEPKYEGTDKYVREIKVTMDKEICGTANWNMETNDALTIGSNPSKSVTLIYAEATQKITDPIWLSIAPVSEVTTMAFTIKVSDSEYLQAVASGLNLTFAEGTQTKIELNVNDKWKDGALQNCYRRIREISEVTEGKYMIIASTSTKTAYLPSSTTDIVPQALEIAADEEVWINAGASNYEWNFSGTPDQMQITNATGNYLMPGVYVDNEQMSWAIGQNGEGTFAIYSGGISVGISGGEWRTYSSYSGEGKTNRIKLYRKVN